MEIAPHSPKLNSSKPHSSLRCAASFWINITCGTTAASLEQELVKAEWRSHLT
jgi:hypothetical protein